MADVQQQPGIEHAANPLGRVIVSIVGLGLTQIIGWGTTFSALAVLGTPISRDLAIPREAVFAGISIMLVVSGLVSPFAGRRFDREGPRRQMIIGSVIAATALGLMSLANGAITYWATWALFGVALPLALGTTAVSAVVQIAGPRARRAVTGFTIIAGLTSFFFLPLSAWLEARLGWRGTLQVFALLHLVLALPTHIAILPTGKPVQSSGNASKDVPWEGMVPAHLRTRAFVLLVAWSCLEGMLVWGFNLQAVDLLQGLGLPLAGAIAVWMFSAPSQAAARVGEFVFGGRYPIMLTGVVSAAMAPIGFVIFYAGGFSTTAATLMAICYGLGHGLYAVARNILPLQLFGLRTFGETMGRLSLPQNIANAFAPILFAALLSRVGPHAALLFAAGCAGVSLLAVAALSRTVAAAQRSADGECD